MNYSHKWLLLFISIVLISCADPQGTVTKGEQDIPKGNGTTSDKTFTRPSSTGGTLTLNSVGYEIDALISYGGGVNYTKATIDAALTAIGTTNKATLLLRPGTWVIASGDADLTIPSNVTLKIPAGAMFSIAAGRTLTINGPFDTGLYKVFNCVGTGAVVFGIGSAKEVYPEWWGGKGDDSTINTAMITAAIATGKDVVFSGGVYRTVGGHRLSATNQNIRGYNNATIKKSSGTSYIIDTTHGAHRVSMSDLRFDGNSLGGSQIIWRAHYSTLQNIYIENQGGANYALRISGCNLSQFRNITVGGGYGGILIDQTADTYVPLPLYGCLYSLFDKIVVAQTTKGSALKLAGSQVQAITFNNLYVEEPVGGVAPAIDISGGPIAAISFNDLSAEYQTMVVPLIKMDGNDIYSIHFNGGRLSTGVTQTQPLFSLINTNAVSIRNMLFMATGARVGRTFIKMSGVKQGAFSDNVVYTTKDFTFIEDAGGNSYITENGNGQSRDGINYPGQGTNLWTDCQHLVIERSQFTQAGHRKEGIPKKR